MVINRSGRHSLFVNLCLGIIVTQSLLKLVKFVRTTWKIGKHREAALRAACELQEPLLFLERVLDGGLAVGFP
ncbi:hypothetical protein C8Q78DRAFT_107005 [Trametes maxima]|nr:hypothetical protein C8Q78DRAFT_107005 [Trametes maxima]